MDEKLSHITEVKLHFFRTQKLDEKSEEKLKYIKGKLYEIYFI